MTTRNRPADAGETHSLGAGGSLAPAPSATSTAAFAKGQPVDTPVQALPVDEHHGLGGEYHLVDGQRVLVSHSDAELKARNN